MALIPYNGIMPKIGKNCFIAESADVIGDVTLGDNTSIWFGAVLRGDVAPITIGQNSNVQDNCTIHVDVGIPTVIGDHVTVGHCVMIHGATIEDNCLIGIGSIVLDKAIVRQGAQVGAAALVPPRKEVPPRSLVMGQPCKVVRELSEADEQGFINHADGYVLEAGKYRK